MTDLLKLCGKVCAIAEQAASFIEQEAGKIHAQDVETKSEHSYVTYVDKKAEEMIVNSLGELLPDAGFIAEENTRSHKAEEFKWVIDPLDGTTNFIHGIPLYSVSIALMQGEDVVIGVVYEVNSHECFYAVKGHGAFLNGQPIRVSRTPDTGNSLLATGFPYYYYDRLAEFMGIFDWCMRNTRGLRRLGSAAVDLAYVACGRLEGFFEYGLNAWDVAAGCLIVQEAGGEISDFSGGNNYIFGRELVATNSLIHQDFMVQVKASFTKIPKQ